MFSVRRTILIHSALLLACLVLSLQTLSAADDKPTTAERVEPNPDLVAVVAGNNAFALDMYSQLAAEENGNLFFSPGSLSTALAMTYAGAGGATESQMAQVLEFSLPQEKLHPAFAQWVNRLNRQDSKSGYRLNMANRLWGQQGFGFLPSFLDVTRENYGAELAQVDFSTNPENARHRINSWIGEQTQGKIAELIPSGVLNTTTRLVLTNAIYFKGDWSTRFEKRLTKQAPFHISADETIKVPLMFQKGKFAYRQFNGVQALELPYGNKDLAMLILLPDRGHELSALEQKLTAEKLADWIPRLRQREVRVRLPKFKLTAQFRLKDTLASMGMTDAFGSQADFSGINGRHDLLLSAVIHQAFVEVNEEGTEAAAASGGAVQLKGVFPEPPLFRADHPFLFLIRDRRTGSILFLGRVLNPKQ